MLGGGTSFKMEISRRTVEGTHSKPTSSNHLPISFQLASNFHWKKIGSFGRELEVFSKLELELEDFEQLEEIRNRLWNLKCRSSPNE